MVKKILISSIMIISLISCGNKSQQNDSAKNNTENKVIENGSWNIDTQQSDAINEDIKTIFSNATKELLGVKRELMLYLGNQIDEGINYAFICRSEILAPSALPYYEIIICNVSDQNETSITKIEKIIESSQSSVGGIICTSSDEAKINTSKSKESEDIIKIFENNKDKFKNFSYLYKNKPFIYNSSPDKDIYLYYKNINQDKFLSIKMKYFKFGMYIVTLPIFYGEDIEYYFVENMKNGNISTKRFFTTNSKNICCWI